MIHREIDDVEILEVSGREEERKREGIERDKEKKKANEREGRSISMETS